MLADVGGTVANNRWLRRILGGSRGRILAELRRGPATVSELIERLALSANAVRAMNKGDLRSHRFTPSNLRSMSSAAQSLPGPFVS